MSGRKLHRPPNYCSATIFAPDLLLGENEVRTGETGGGEPPLENEIFTTKFFGWPGWLKKFMKT